MTLSRPALVCALLLSHAPLFAQVTLVPYGSTWKYLDDGTDPGSAWTLPAPGFDDSTWAGGPAQLGYGDGDEATVVSFGPNASAKYVTTFFRHEFTVVDASVFVSLDLRMVRDDGVVVHLNGTELARVNMPATSNHLTFASSTIDVEAETIPEVLSLPVTGLVTGTNLLAVEVHQRSLTSSDISFDLRLVGHTDLVVERGPYLQLGGHDRITVRWRTNLPSDSRVRYGAAPGSLTSFVDDAAVGTEHEVELTGLAPETTYSYSVGDTGTTLAGADSEHFFETAPLPGTSTDTRIWVVGDSGTGSADQAAVRDAYEAFTGARHTDLWLMLGDNAYVQGTDSQYQVAMYEAYSALLRKSVVWPTRGNHDDSAAVYQGMFTLPTAAEIGGVPSGTEAYYSFDHANVHFVCLDSEGSNRNVGGPMWTWLESDLAATDQQWIIAYWHHPPYTRGSHDSESEVRLVQMRQNFNPVLEDGGVDLVLCGHSHSYERSYPLAGHYGFMASLTPDMILDSGDGNPAGDGAYVQFPGPNNGTVYTVAGSSGKISGGTFDHAAMHVSLMELASVVIDADASALEVTCLDDTGAVLDTFRIEEARTELCNGDGGDQMGCTNCPCGNDAVAGTVGGCLNSAGSATRLVASGSTSVTLPPGSAGDLRFGLAGAPAVALCLLASGDAVAPTNAANPCFGAESGVQSALLDGLRCAVANTLRHGTRFSDANGAVGVISAPWGGSGAPPAGIAGAGAGFAAGQTRYFQSTHRDDPAMVCARGLNTSQAIEVVFTP